MEQRNINSKEDEGTHLNAGYEVFQVWESIQAPRLKYAVHFKDVISQEIHIGELQKGS